MAKSVSKQNDEILLTEKQLDSSKLRFLGGFAFELLKLQTFTLRMIVYKAHFIVQKITSLIDIILRNKDLEIGYFKINISCKHHLILFNKSIVIIIIINVFITYVRLRVRRSNFMRSKFNFFMRSNF